MRRMRGVALGAIVLASALIVAGCAKDRGSSGGNTTGGGQACKTQPKPEGAAAATTTTAAGEKVDGSALRVGFAYDIGGRGDASFNDASVAGLERAISELNIKRENTRELSAGAAESEANKQSRLRQLASEGFSPIIAVGFAYADALKAVAAEFPTTKFAIIDATVEGASNVTPLQFAEEQGSYLVGVVAAYKSKKCHIGFVGGMQSPLIAKFEAGFVQGAKAVAPDIKIEKKYLSPAGDPTGFNDPAKGNEAAKGQIDVGADVLYHAAGASGKGVFSAAKAGGATAIGVDADQYNQPTVAEYKDVIISSMLKRVDVAIFDYLKAVAKNDLSTLPKRFDLQADGVGYATSGGKIDDIKSTVDAYRAKIISGEIKVSDKPTS